MNTKTLRNDYRLLSMRERYSLLEAASLRDDQSEIAAIKAASPKVSFQGMDLSKLAETVQILHKHNLLERIGLADIAMDLFTAICYELFPEKPQNLFESFRVAAYLYVVETDSWIKACDEFGADAKKYRRWQAKLYYAAERLETHDELFRDCAFSEREILARFPNGRTVESVAQSYLKYLRQIEAENKVV